MSNPVTIATGGCLGVLLTIVLSAAVIGWVIMLLCGALYAEFNVLAPIGFWPATGIGVLVSTVLSFFRS